MITASVIKGLNNTEAELKKGVTYEKSMHWFAHTYYREGI